MFTSEQDLLSGEYTDASTESLQTDIQRFVAILGFCLMAVFALVQALPVTGAKQDMALEDLGRLAAAQEQQLERLHAENERLGSEAEQLIRESGFSRMLSRDVRHLRGDLLQQRGLIAMLKQEKAVQAADVMAYRKLLDRRDQQIRDLKQKETLLARSLEDMRRSRHAERPEGRERAVRTADTPAAAGRYVAFESDQVFLDLLSSGEISLFIQVVDLERPFQVTLRSHRVDFEPVSSGLEHDLWELKEHLVPSQIVNAFGRWTNLASRRKMFIVGLSPAIMGQIRGRGTGGSYIIRKGGDVRFSR
jgi:cell division protein FtsB